MKVAFCILGFTILIINSYGQTVIKNCNLIVEKDLFYGTVIRSSNYELIGRGGHFGELRFKLSENIGKDTIMNLHLRIKRRSIRCFGPDAKMMLKNDERIITLPLFRKDGCGINLENYAILSHEDIVYLSRNIINAVRVIYSNGIDSFDDFTLDNIKNEKWQNSYRNKFDYFTRTLKCFE
jgi:hypothetical protein